MDAHLPKPFGDPLSADLLVDILPMANMEDDDLRRIVAD